MTCAKYKHYNDSELVSLCLQGDSCAWESLVLRYRRLIYSIPVKFNMSFSDAADVYQSICLKLIENLHKLKDDTKVSAWLITTTTRQCIALRSQRFREFGNEDGYTEPSDPAENLEQIHLQVEEQQAVRDAIEQLPDRCRQLLELLYFDTSSPSYGEVSQILGMPVASIGPTRARCFEKLRTILRRYGIKHV